MSFGQKSSAWARPQGANQPQQINPNLFTNQLGLATAGQAFSSIPGMPINSGLLVNQAAFTNMNTVLAQAQRQMLPPQMQQQQQRSAPTNTSPNRSQRTFIGVVTKLMETYGFVDEDVFFQTNVIRGAAIPRVGDRVMVEANYNPSMPFKWNARSIEKIQNVDYRQETLSQQTQQYQHHQGRQIQQQQQQQNGSSTRWGERVPREEFVREPRRQPAPVHRTPPRESAPRGSQSRQRSPPIRRSPQPTRRQEPSLKRDREVRTELENRERDRESVRARSPHSSKRETASPPRRRQRILPRYYCNVPKQTLHNGELKYAELRKRYSSLYIPSDFVRCKFNWIDSIKLETPLSFSPHPIHFHILHKDVDLEGIQLPPENPSDADGRYVVKVLLLSHPGISALRRKLSGLLPDGSIDEVAETQPLAKNIHLLVGYRGKGELMCIGGAWSPSLDGENPLDPQTIVKTAIRTTLTLTGIDLSNCAKWYKMMHLRYFRPERNRIDSCVLMLPDTSSVPEFQITEEQYRQAEQSLQSQLAAKLSAIDAEQFVSPNHEKGKSLGASVGGTEEVVVPTAEGALNGGEEGKGAEEGAVQAPTADAQQTESTETAEAEDAMDTKQAEPGSDLSQETTAKNGKTHWSILEQNIKAMKVAELREELEARNLESKGVKNALMLRLQEAIAKEKAEDNASNKDPPPIQSQTAIQQQPTNEIKEKTEKESIVVQIKEEIIELMETDEVGDKPDDGEGEKKDDESEAQKQAEKERVELEKAKEKFEKEKKERKAALERHYGQVSKNEAGIFIYPSKTAKSGKFDCKLMSLHSLLEYSKEHDNKEASFEVFLFAEALKEAFDRSKAFIVYHTVSTALDRDAEKKRRNESLSEACKDDEVVVLNDGNKKEEKEEKSKSPSILDLRTNFKALVNDFEAFMAFTHFDSNISGYVLDKDLEEIIHSIGLDLSRWDVQHIIKKLASKDRVSYRDITDKWVDKEGNVKYTPSPSYDNLLQSYAEHAKGHKSLIDMGFNTEAKETDPKAVNESGIVLFEGSLVNIKQSIEHQYAMEKERQETIDKNEKLELQMTALKEQRDYLEKKKRRNEDDLERYKKKLHDTEKQLKTEQESNATMKNALQDCKRYSERVIGAVEKIIPPPKKEEKEKVKEKDDEVVILEGADCSGKEKKDSIAEKMLAKMEENSKDEKENGKGRAKSL